MEAQICSETCVCNVNITRYNDSEHQNLKKNVTYIHHFGDANINF
jgi:hypothetical protein